MSLDPLCGDLETYTLVYGKFKEAWDSKKVEIAEEKMEVSYQLVLLSKTHCGNGWSNSNTGKW